MKKSSVLMFLILNVLFFVGCTNKNVENKLLEKKILANKEIGHIIFAKTRFTGLLPDSEIVKINPKTLESKIIGSLGTSEKLIYSVDEGKHYFFINNGNFENIIFVNVEKGNKYFVSTSKTSPLGWIAIDFSDNRLLLKKQIISEECSKRTINKYMFEELDNESDSSSFDGYHEKNKYSSESLKVEIECKNNKIVNYNDLYTQFSPNDLEEFDLLNINEKQYRNDDIISSYNFYKKFEGIPITESVLISYNKFIENKYLNNFDSVKIINNSKNSKTVTNEKIEEFDKKIKEKFNYSEKVGNNPIFVEYSLEKYYDGNMLKRYIASGFSNKFSGGIKVKVKILSKDENEITDFELTAMEVGGFLGGINTLQFDTIKLLSKLINNNLLKKTVK